MTAAAPQSAAWRACSTTVRAAGSDTPTTTGTAPPTSPITISTTRRRSAPVRVQNSWWMVWTDRPPTPGFASVARTFRASAGSSIEPSGRNGV